MRKRIAILSHEFPPFHGGIGTYCAEMAAAASSLGHDVTVFAPDYGRDNEAEDRARPYCVVRFKGGVYRTRDMLRVLRETLRITRQGYDIIHAAEWSFAVACHVIYRLRKFPFITTLHGTDIFGFQTSKIVALLHARKGLGHARYVTANSDFTARLAREYHPYYPPEKIITTHLGVGQWWFENAENAGTVRARHDIAAGRKIILTVARLDERKGHACTLRAIAMLPQQEKDQLTYVIVGGATSVTHEAYLKTLAAGCGVPVVFAGRIDNEDVRALYKESWLFCMPGQKDPKKVEGFGLAYLEAAAQGLPSLATAIGGVPEVVIDGKTGWLLADDRPETLAAAISRLLAQPEQVQAFGGAARAWASQFSWQRCAKQTYDADLTQTILKSGG